MGNLTSGTWVEKFFKFLFNRSIGFQTIAIAFKELLGSALLALRTFPLFFR
jgi:hypothetical protein